MSLNTSKIDEKFVLSDDDSLFEVIGVQNENIDSLDSAPYSYWKEVFKVLSKKPIVWVCLAGLLLIVFFTLFGLLIKKDFLQWVGIIYEGPSAEHWFGIDGQGRDLWTYTWQGAQKSFGLAILVSIINAVLGLVIGSIWGFFPKIDPFMIELRNFISNVPSLLLNILLVKALLVAAVPTFWGVLTVLILFGWLPLASTIRNQIIIIRNRDFNIASRTLGSSPAAMISHNLLPQLISIIVILLANSVPAAIDSEVSLSYFGMSISEVGAPSLGMLINQGAIDTNWVTSPHIIMLPALVTIVITVGCYYIGFALADAADPRTHR